MWELPATVDFANAEVIEKLLHLPFNRRGDFPVRELFDNRFKIPVIDPNSFCHAMAWGPDYLKFSAVWDNNVPDSGKAEAAAECGRLPSTRWLHSAMRSILASAPPPRPPDVFLVFSGRLK